MSSVLAEKSRLHFENAWTNSLVRSYLSPEDTLAFNALRFTGKFHIHPHTTLVVWRKVGDVPEILANFRWTDMKVSFKTGPVAILTGDLLNFTATHVPHRIPGTDVFIWLPGMNELRWCPMTWDDPKSPRILRTGIIYKQQGCIEDGAREGTHYLSTHKSFYAHWPEHKI